MSTYSSRRSSSPIQPYRDNTTPPPRVREALPRESSEYLVSSAARMGHQHNRSSSRESDGMGGRQPTLPDMGGYRGVAY